MASVIIFLIGLLTWATYADKCQFGSYRVYETSWNVAESISTSMSGFYVAKCSFHLKTNFGKGLISCARLHMTKDGPKYLSTKSTSSCHFRDLKQSALIIESTGKLLQCGGIKISDDGFYYCETNREEIDKECFSKLNENKSTPPSIAECTYSENLSCSEEITRTTPIECDKGKCTVSQQIEVIKGGSMVTSSEKMMTETDQVQLESSGEIGMNTMVSAKISGKVSFTNKRDQLLKDSTTLTTNHQRKSTKTITIESTTIQEQEITVTCTNQNPMILTCQYQSEKWNKINYTCTIDSITTIERFIRMTGEKATLVMNGKPNEKKQ